MPLRALPNEAEVVDHGVAEVAEDSAAVWAGVGRFGAAVDFEVVVAAVARFAGAEAATGVDLGAASAEDTAEDSAGTDATAMAADFLADTVLASASATRPGIGLATLTDIPTITDIPTTITDTRAITDTTHMLTVDSPLIHRRLLIVP